MIFLTTKNHKLTTATLRTLGHEIGHACGLEDINEGAFLFELVSKELVGEKNWTGGTGTGYYHPALKHWEMLKYRLLMYVPSNGDGLVIPLGSVMGIEPNYPSVTTPRLINVGVDLMNRTPRH